VKLLADSSTEAQVQNSLKQMSPSSLLDFLGASAWESICTAYLILEEEFVPTGLCTGRTLPILDMIGHRKSDAAHIYAQCKKNDYAVLIESDFIRLCNEDDTKHVGYYFAYGGCSGEVPSEIRVITRSDILRWSESANGELYWRLLLGS
jgi:hypothetical protein